MAVTEESSLNVYTANGVTTVFAYAFYLPAATDLTVQVVTGGSPSTKVLNVDYTVSGVGVPGGGSVTFTTAPANLSSVVIFRDTRLARDTDYQNNGDLLAESLNTDLDRPWLALQDIYSGGKGTPTALRVPNGETVPALGNAAARANRVQAYDGNGDPLLIAGVDSGSAAALALDLADSTNAAKGARLLAYNATLAYAGGIGQFLNYTHARTAGETSAGITPTNYAYLPHDLRRYGAALDATTDDATKLTDAITAAGLTGEGGGYVYLHSIAAIKSTITQPNRVRFEGQNVRKAGLKAVATFTGSYMINAVNGTSSMFDAGLEDLNLDCNDIASLGGVLSDAWQENSDVRRVLINKFRTYGIRYQNGYGGASSHKIEDAEIFGSSSGATAGIRVDQISVIGAFKLTVMNSTVAGGGALPSSLPKGIDIVNDSTVLINVHFETCQSGVYIDGVGDHVIINCDGAGGGSLVDNVVEIASTFTGSLKMIGCRRNGATNLLKDNRTGGLGTITGYDTDVDICRAPKLGPGQINSCGQFDGTSASPAVTNCFNVSSISRTATGTYTITETRGRPTVQGSMWANSNLAGGRTTVNLVGASTYQILTYDSAGALANSNEIKFGCVRLV